MKEKRGILAAAILLIVLAAGVWAYSRPEKTILLKGNVSARDVREIERAVKKTMRAEVFPSVSWENLKALPRRARWYLKHEVQSITVSSPNLPAVAVVTSSDTNSVSTDLYYNANKETNGWKVVVRPPWWNAITADSNFALVKGFIIFVSVLFGVVIVGRYAVDGQRLAPRLPIGG